MQGAESSWRPRLAVVLAAMLAAVMVWSAGGAQAQSYPAVSSLIVKYEKGKSPGAGPVPRGADKVPSPVRELLRVGPALGFGMYRVDFSTPVAPATARSVARQLTASPLIALAEVDATATIQRKPRY